MNFLSIISVLESLVIDAEHIEDAKNVVIEHLRSVESMAEKTIEATADIAESVVNIVK